MAVDRFATIRRPIYGKTQKVAYTGTAGTISAALPPGTNAVRVTTTTLAYVKVGWGSVAATTADAVVQANVPVDIPLEPPHNNDTAANVAAGAFVSAIQDSTGGNLIVTPLAD